MVAGDFNAHVSANHTNDEGEEVVGSCFYSSGNLRGDWLVFWCMAARLIITSSTACTRNSWTYNKGDGYLQIDFILSDRSLYIDVKECGLLDDIDIGSDHRMVFAIFIDSVRPIRRHKPCR